MDLQMSFGLTLVSEKISENKMVTSYFVDGNGSGNTCTEG